MTLQVDFRVLELLCARLCHELVSPVGAINNGVELLDDEDAEFVKDAIALIGQSARKAGQRLQFYRFAYGTIGSISAGTVAVAQSGRDLALGLLEGGKIGCEWPAEATTLPLDWQRLACNMLVLAAEALPRGGTIVLKPLRDGRSGIEVNAEGETVNLSAELRAAIDEGVAVDQLSSRTVHGYFTARLAGSLGARLALAAPDPKRAVLSALAGG